MHSTLAYLLIGLVSVLGCYSLAPVGSSAGDTQQVQYGSVRSMPADHLQESILSDFLDDRNEPDSFLKEVEQINLPDPIILYNAGVASLDRQDFENARQFFTSAVMNLEKSGMPCTPDTNSQKSRFYELKKQRASPQGVVSPELEAEEYLPAFKSFLLGNSPAIKLLSSLQAIEHRSLGEPRFKGAAGIFLQLLTPFGAPVFDPILVGYPSVADNTAKKKVREYIYTSLGLALLLTKDISGLRGWRTQVANSGVTNSEIQTLSLIDDWLQSKPITLEKYPAIPKLCTFFRGGS